MKEEEEEEEEKKKKKKLLKSSSSSSCAVSGCHLRSTRQLDSSGKRTFLLHCAWFDSGYMRLWDVFDTFST